MNLDPTQLNTTPIVGGGGSCPALAENGASGDLSGAFMGELLSPSPQWCEYIGALHAIVIFTAAMSALYINIKGI